LIDAHPVDRQDTMARLVVDKERVEREKEREAKRLELLSLPRRLSSRVQVG
jgi:hypothetical protein